MSDRSRTSRVEAIGDAALAVLAERGARGLTHRAVDEHLGLPVGSTSYYARTRAALLVLAVERVAALEGADVAIAAPPPRPDDRAALADDIADRLHRLLADPTRLVARYELALEARRRPDLRRTYGTAGGQFHRVLTDVLAEAGSAEPARHARVLIDWCEGTLFNAVAGARAGHPPAQQELRTTMRELLAAMLPAR